MQALAFLGPFGLPPQPAIWRVAAPIERGDPHHGRRRQAFRRGQIGGMVDVDNQRPGALAFFDNFRASLKRAAPVLTGECAAGQKLKPFRRRVGSGKGGEMEGACHSPMVPGRDAFIQVRKCGPKRMGRLRDRGHDAGALEARQPQSRVKTARSF